MTYGDDQCERCGAVRVAKSTLCPQCLVRQLDRGKRKKQVLQAIVDKRDLEIAILRSQREDALAYGFKQNQENVELKQRVKGLCGKIREVMEDEKNRETEDIGL